MSQPEIPLEALPEAEEMAITGCALRSLQLYARIRPADWTVENGAETARTCSSPTCDVFGKMVTFNTITNTTLGPDEVSPYTCGFTNELVGIFRPGQQG